MLPKLALAASFALLLGSPALEAREYPWCAEYDPYTRNCGFSTFEQCRATIFGVGGICRPNPRFYAGPPPSPNERRAPRYDGRFPR